MTTSEKLVILDFLKRKRWYYIVGLLVHLASLIGCWWDKEVIFLGLLPCSAALLLFEQIRGKSTSRTLLTLPITPSQLGNAWRTVTFTLPALAAAAILSFTTLIAAAFKAPLLNPAGFLIIAFTQTAILGTMLFFLAGPPPLGRNSRLNLALRKFFLIFWGLSLPAISSLSHHIPRSSAEIGKLQIIAGLFMGTATIVAWFGCKRLVAGNSAPSIPAREFSAKPTNSGKTVLTPRFGGIPYLIQWLGFNLFCMTASTTVILWIFASLDGRAGGSGRNNLGLSLVIPILFFFGVQTLVSQLRILRSLPISRAALTHLLLFAPVLVFSGIGLIGSGIDTGIHLGMPQWTIWPLLIPTMTLATTFLPMILRYGIRSWTFLAGMFILIFFNIMISELHHQPETTLIPLLYLIPLSCAVLAINWTITYRLLASHHPWRAAAVKSA